MIRILEQFSVFLRLDSQFASNSVLDILDTGVESGRGESGHCSAEVEGWGTHAILLPASDALGA
jgi:hypothetical protein